MGKITLEDIIQILSILAFIGCAIKFFVQTGQYKAIIEVKMTALEEDIKELKTANTKLEEEVGKLKLNTNTSIARMEALLVEVKTKLELIIQFVGLGENGKFKK